MLYGVGEHLGGASPGAAATQVCADANFVIGNWDPETITVSRNIPTFDGTGMRVNNFSSIGSFIGDWQPVSGKTVREEEGRLVKSEAFIISPCDIDTVEDDKITKEDGSTMFVNYVKRYRGHITVFLKKTEGSD